MRSSRRGVTAFVVAGSALALALAFFVSPLASSSPDGLEKVAADQGFDRTEEAHALAGSPTAGYELQGVDDDRISTGLAGILGVAVTSAVVGGLLVVVRRSRRAEPDPRPA